jgi:hypothetical protein
MLELHFRRRSVEASRHSRESVLIRRFSPCQHGLNVRETGLSHPHSGKVRVPRTGTLPPPSYGKGPTAVGESVMGLPGSPRDPAMRLTGKGSERESWERAARVVGGRESRSQGETAIRSLEMTLASGMRG